MALRALQGPTGGGAPVGGSGTPGTIPVWSSGTTLGNSIITQDTNTIGIRQAAPSAYLAGFNTLVVGDPAFANTGITLASGSASDGTFAFADGTAGNAAYRGYIQYKHATDAMQIGVAASPQITILGAGNVGIGTASPGTQLHVERAGGSTANTEYLRLRNTTNATNSNASVSFYVSNNSVATGAISHTAAAGPSYDTVFSNWNGSTLAEAMRITQGGNVYAASGTTGMTTGFFYIPAAAGAPTGVPTAISGRVPMYYDTTNNNFYVYNGGWKKVLLA
jgi:hypothetical protein